LVAGYEILHIIACNRVHMVEEEPIFIQTVVVRV